jgi:hypothetical protein
LPVGYRAGVSAYRAALDGLDEHALTTHYTDGLDWFRGEFADRLVGVLAALTGGSWDLSGWAVYGAGSDVDFMAHVVEAVAAREGISLYPGDWHGFRVGCTHPKGVRWTEASAGTLACLCVPSVRNGHLTASMADFLATADACLLNLNLFPTLAAAERRVTADLLRPMLHKSVLSISFSRGFGLTASQLGVALVPPGHPYRQRFATQWEWLTYFHNAVAARAFHALDLAAVQAVDVLRREWVGSWLRKRGLQPIETGSYYVKAYRPEGALPAYLAPLDRGGVVRLCFKPPQA